MPEKKRLPDSTPVRHQNLPTGGYGPSRAKGGPVKKGKRYLVGEKGPEKFVPKGKSSGKCKGKPSY